MTIVGIYFKFSCLVNVFVFPFKVHRRSASFFLSQKHRRALNFRLDFLIKKGKVGVWFIIYLMKNVYTATPQKLKS